MEMGSGLTTYQIDTPTIKTHHKKFQLNPLRNGRDIDCLEFRWVGDVVGSDALPSSSPSLIWLQLGFGLAGAVTILSCDKNVIET